MHSWGLKNSASQRFIIQIPKLFNFLNPGLWCTVATWTCPSQWPPSPPSPPSSWCRYGSSPWVTWSSRRLISRSPTTKFALTHSAWSYPWPSAFSSQGKTWLKAAADSSEFWVKSFTQKSQKNIRKSGQIFSFREISTDFSNCSYLKFLEIISENCPVRCTKKSDQNFFQNFPENFSELIYVTSFFNISY